MDYVGRDSNEVLSLAGSELLVVLASDGNWGFAAFLFYALAVLVAFM
jgi:hypothetical protein